MCGSDVDRVSAEAGTRRRSQVPRQRQKRNVTVVPVVRVSRSNLASNLVLTGEFLPYQEIDVMAKEAGYVKSIRVDIGDRVRAGQLLAELEIPEMQDDMERATAGSTGCRSTTLRQREAI